MWRWSLNLEKRYLGMTLEVKNGFVFQGFIITPGKKKKTPKKPVKVALLVFDTVTEIHWNIRKRKKSFTKKLGLKSSALVDVDLGEQESSYWNAAGCCWLSWELGCAWAGGPISPRSWPSAAPAWRCARPGWRSCPWWISAPSKSRPIWRRFAGRQNRSEESSGVFQGKGSSQWDCWRDEGVTQTLEQLGCSGHGAASRAAQYLLLNHPFLCVPKDTVWGQGLVVNKVLVLGYGWAWGSRRSFPNLNGSVI